MSRKTVVIKMGGKAASSDEGVRALATEMSLLSDQYLFVFVHGGGAEVSRVSRVFGLEPVFKDGVRLTSPAEMEIVDMVLSGSFNKKLVRIFNSCMLDAVGLSGSDGALFTGEPLERESGTRTGRVTKVNTRLVELLLQVRMVPVVSSTSMDKSDGGALNINADEAALALAQALKADRLVFMSDIPGVLKDGAVIARIDRGTADAEISAGVISGGMIPKIKTSLEAVASGVGGVVIGEYAKPGDVLRLITGKIGTTVSV